MSGGPGNYGDSLFDEFRRMKDEMIELFGRSPWPAGIRRCCAGPACLSAWMLPLDKRVSSRSLPGWP